MKRLESNFINMVLSTTVVALIAAGILGYVYGVTKDPIATAKKAKQEAAIKQVLPQDATPGEMQEVTVNVDGKDVVCKVYPGTDANGNLVGAAVESNVNGFGGNIKIMTGFDAEGNIVDYAVLEQAETPGLGAKIPDWFKTDKNNQNIKGKNPETNKLTVSKDGGEVDAITAATISSRAFLLAVNNAYAAYKQANTTAPAAGNGIEGEQAEQIELSEQTVQVIEVADAANAADETVEVVVKEEKVEKKAKATFNNPIPDDDED